jgi:hypothetical protein
VGQHTGDYKQALSYFGNANEAQVLVEYTFDVKTFFKPENLALPKRGLDDLRNVLETKFPDSVYEQASQDQGTHANRPGLKAENRGAYSVGLSNAAMAKFVANAKSIKVLEYHMP